MDLLPLARVEFAITAGGHFLFVVLTLGLATLLVVMQTGETFRPSAERRSRLWFWGRLYVVNYAFGIVTGLVMEFELALNWSRLTTEIGPALAVETIVAFFVESTFLGLWLFGWDRLPRWVHLAVIWVVALTAHISAYVVLVANGHLQSPSADPWVNPAAWTAFAHVTGAGLVTAGIFVAGIGAYHHDRRSVRFGAWALLPGMVIVAAAGHQQFIRGLQPMKLALWDGTGTERAALQAELVAAYGPGDYIPPAWAATALLAMLIIGALLIALALAGPFLARPTPAGGADRQAKKRASGLGIHAGTSAQRTADSDEQDPVSVEHAGTSAQRMADSDEQDPVSAEHAGTSAQRMADSDEQDPVSAEHAGRGVGPPSGPEEQRVPSRGAKIFLYAIPLPFLAVLCGWIFREVGRQPWAVYGRIKVADAITPGAGVVQFALFGPIFVTLAVLNVIILWRHAKDKTPLQTARPQHLLTAEERTPYLQYPL
jgi:cytochrome d ubiquinol oxidase subunit I